MAPSRNTLQHGPLSAQGWAGARLWSSSSARAPGARCRPAPARSARPAARTGVSGRGRAQQRVLRIRRRPSRALSRKAHVDGARGPPDALVHAFAVLWHYDVLLLRHHERAIRGHGLRVRRCRWHPGSATRERAPTATVRRRHMSSSTCEHGRTVGDFTVCEACWGAAAAEAKQRARGNTCMRRDAAFTAAVCCRAADRAALLLCCLSAACCRRGHPRWMPRASAGPAPPAGRLSLACILSGFCQQRDAAFASL